MRRDFGSDDILWELVEDEEFDGGELSDIPPDYREKVDKYLRVAFDQMFRPDPLQELRAKLIQLALALDFAKEYNNLTPTMAESLLSDTITRSLSLSEEREITEELNKAIDEGEVDAPDDLGDFEQFISSITDKL